MAATIGAAASSQMQQQPSSIYDDFEVIEEAQSLSVVSINPFEMSLPTEHTSLNVDSLSRQIGSVSERLTTLASHLSGNNEAMLQLHSQLKKSREQNNGSSSSKGSNHEVENQQLKSELQKWQNHQEEWQQTALDYAHLKGLYNKLIDATEQLKSEKAELLCKLQEATATNCSTAIDLSQIPNNKSEESQQQGCLEQLQSNQHASTNQLEQMVQQAELEEMQKTIIELQEQLLEKQNKLDDEKLANERMMLELTQAQERSLSSESSMNRMLLQITQLEMEVKEGKEKFCDIERQHQSDLTYLRQNSNVRRLEELRDDLARRQERELELNRIYGESDQAVDQIIRTAEEDKRLLSSEIASLKRQIEAMEAALTENGRRLTEATGREMEAKEELARLRNVMTQQSEGHDLKLRQVQEDLRNTSHRLGLELESERRAARLKDARLRDLEARLAEATSAAEQSKATLERLGRESDATVAEILATTEAENRTQGERIGDLERRLGQVESELVRKAQSLAEALNSVANLQRHSDNLQADRDGLNRQLAESKHKMDDAISMAAGMRDRLQAECARAAGLEAQLADLKIEHARVRSSHFELEHKITEMLASEHSVKARADQAEETMRIYSAAMEENRRDFERERNEKQALIRERDILLEQLQRTARGSFGQ